MSHANTQNGTHGTTGTNGTSGAQASEDPADPIGPTTLEDDVVAKAKPSKPAPQPTKKSFQKKKHKKKPGEAVNVSASPVASSAELPAEASAIDTSVAEGTAVAEPVEAGAGAGLSEPGAVEAQPTTNEEIRPATNEETGSVTSEETPAPVEGPLRLRMKIWTDPTTGTRYLMTSAFMRDIVDGRPVSDVMYAYAMRDDDIKQVTLRAAEWNTMPFYYFQEDGPAPRMNRRPVNPVG